MKNLKLIVKTGYKDMDVYLNKEELDVSDSDLDLAICDVSVELRESVDTGEDYEIGELIARLDGLYFDMDYIVNEGLSVFEVFDSYSQETYNLYEALFDSGEYKEEFEAFNSNLFYLRDIYVEEKYRNQGYASMLIDKLYEIVSYHGKLNVGVIATMMYDPSCLNEFEGIKDLSMDDKKKLIKNMEEVFVNKGYVYSSENTSVLVKETS